MPFTASHAAAALPFLRTPLPAAGLVIGTLAPDLPYFLPFGTMRDHTHEPLGVVTIDLVIGLVAWLVWRLVRSPVLGLSPAWLRLRLGPADAAPWQSGPRWWAALLLLLGAIVVGAITHLLLDAPTHPGWVADHLPALQLTYAGALLTAWLQRLFSVVLAGVLVIWVVRWARRTAPRADPAPERDALRRGTWAAVVVVFLASALGSWVILHALGRPWFDSGTVFAVARVSIGCLLAATAVCCGLWAFASRARGSIAA